MSKKILVLGAGLVAAPLVKHLLKKNDFEITVADMIAEKAKKLVEGSKNGKSVSFSIDDKARLKKEIERANVVVSLLPATCHMDVAEICLETGRDLFHHFVCETGNEGDGGEDKGKGAPLHERGWARPRHRSYVGNARL